MTVTLHFISGEINTFGMIMWGEKAVEFTNSEMFALRQSGRLCVTKGFHGHSASHYTLESIICYSFVFIKLAT